MTLTTRSSRVAHTPEDLAVIDRYWRAANYLSVGQIYLLDNPLLREPPLAEHVKPRLLGHWGTTPGLNLLYAHLNRVIKTRDLDALYVTGPGHGGPGLVANAYLEGTYSEVYASIGQDEEGMRALFRQFSFPGGIPSHVAPETPGSIRLRQHEIVAVARVGLGVGARHVKHASTTRGGEAVGGSSCGGELGTGWGSAEMISDGSTDVDRRVLV
jgi:phosphoketolase